MSDSATDIPKFAHYIPRNGRYRDHVRVDRVEDGYVHFFPQGGGFIKKMPYERFVEQFRELEDSDIPKEPQRAVFELEGLEETFPGFHYGERWNGWAHPYFDLETARRVLEVFAAGGVESWSEDDEFFYLHNVSDEGEDAEYPKQSHLVDGDNVILSPIGSGEFTWDIVPE